MKNKNLLKTFGIALLVVFILTWVIPTTTSGTNGLKIGAITPTGFVDIFKNIEVLVQYFLGNAIMILFVGMLYGVCNKSGALKALVDKMSSIFKKKSWLFVVITVLFYGLSSGIAGIYMPMLIFMPLSIAVLLNLKYNKMQALLVTAGSTVVGITAEIGSAIYKSVTGITTNTYLWIKVVLLAILLILVILYALKINKKNGDEETDEYMFVPSKRLIKGTSPKGIALFVVMILLYVFLFLGLFSEFSSVKAFENIANAINGVKIGNFAIFASIMGAFEIFGKFTMISVYALIALAIIIISICNKVSVKDMFEGCMQGVNKVSGIAMFAVLINLILVLTLNSGFIITIINLIAKSGNVALVTLSTLIASPFMVEETYAAQYILQILYAVTSNEGALGLYGFIGQVMYGFTMLFAPSSVLIMCMLYYLGEKYTKWIKYIWKLLIVVFVACLIAITIAILI